MLEMIVKDRMSEVDESKLHYHGDNHTHPLKQTMSSSSIDMSVKRDQGCMESLVCEGPRYLLIDLVLKSPAYSFVWEFQDLLTAIHLFHRLSDSSSVSQLIVPSQTPSEKTRKKNFALHPESERSVYCLPSSHDPLTVSKEGFLSEKKILDTDSLKNRNSRIRRGVMAGPIASSLQVTNFDSLSWNEFIKNLNPVIINVTYFFY